MNRKYQEVWKAMRGGRGREMTGEEGGGRK